MNNKKGYIEIGHILGVLIVGFVLFGTLIYIVYFIQPEIISECERICEKNNLEYFNTENNKFCVCVDDDNIIRHFKINERAGCFN